MQKNTNLPETNGVLVLHFWNSPIQTFFCIYYLFLGITSIFQSGMNKKKDGVNVASFHVETTYQKDVLLLCTRIPYNSTGKHFSSNPLYSFLLWWKSGHSRIGT